MGVSPGEESRDDGVAAQAIDGAAGLRPDLAITRRDVRVLKQNYGRRCWRTWCLRRRRTVPGAAKNSRRAERRARAGKRIARDSPPPFDVPAGWQARAASTRLQRIRLKRSEALIVSGRDRLILPTRGRA